VCLRAMGHFLPFAYLRIVRSLARINMRLAGSFLAGICMCVRFGNHDANSERPGRPLTEPGGKDLIGGMFDIRSPTSVIMVGRGFYRQMWSSRTDSIVTNCLITSVTLLHFPRMEAQNSGGASRPNGVSIQDPPPCEPRCHVKMVRNSTRSMRKPLPLEFLLNRVFGLG